MYMKYPWGLPTGLRLKKHPCIHVPSSPRGGRIWMCNWVGSIPTRFLSRVKLRLKSPGSMTPPRGRVVSGLSMPTAKGAPDRSWLPSQGNLGNPSQRSMNASSSHIQRGQTLPHDQGYLGSSMYSEIYPGAHTPDPRYRVYSRLGKKKGRGSVSARFHVLYCLHDDERPETRSRFFIRNTWSTQTDRSPGRLGQYSI